MSRRRVYLLRHGEVSYFAASGAPLRSDTVPLTERGREQARAAAEALREVPFDLVLTSALARTEETADLVLEGRSIARRREPTLNEIRPGNVLALGDLARVRQAVLSSFVDAPDPDARFLAGERFADFHARVRDAFSQVMADESWSTLLLVAHGGVNRAILSEAMGSGLSVYGSLEQDPACINVLDVDCWEQPGRRAIVRTVNYTPYDPAKRNIHGTTMEELWMRFERLL